MSNFIHITPFMRVADLDKALAFFGGILGFDVSYRSDNYAYMHREGVGIRIVEDGCVESTLAQDEMRYAYYIDVRDVDALYAELKAGLDTLPPEQVWGPVNQEYGMREFALVVPDGKWLAFGQWVDRG